MFDTLRPLLEHAVDRWRRLSAADAAAGCCYELEMRVGLCVDARERRVAPTPTTPTTTFVSNVNDSLFYGTFEALARRATSVTPLVRSKHGRYDAFPGCRRDLANDTWARKRTLSVSDHAGRPFWFDVRLSLAAETSIDEPDAVREGRAIARRIRMPLQNERTRGAYPSSERARERRSLVFADAPSWRLDFTRVAMSCIRRMHTGAGDDDGMQYGYDATPANTLELELECVADADTADTASIVADATTLLERVATALGTSLAAIRRRIDADRERYDRAHSTMGTWSI